MVTGVLTVSSNNPKRTLMLQLTARKQEQIKINQQIHQKFETQQTVSTLLR